MESRYRKFKGWSGKVYWVRMSEEEVEERRKLHLFLGVITITPIWTFIMCIAAGLFK